MKKIFAIVLGAALMLSGTNAFAQLSVGAGWLNSTETVKSGNNDPSKTNLNGFYVGGQYNLPIVAGLGVAPGLYVSGIFAKVNNSDSAYGVSGSTNASSREHFDILAMLMVVSLLSPLMINRNLSSFREYSSFSGTHSQSWLFPLLLVKLICSFLFSWSARRIV